MALVSVLVAGSATAGKVPQVSRLSVFPVAGGCFYSDTWGAARSGGRRHEGVDIIANEGTPLVAVVDGTVTKIVRDTPGSLGGNYFRLTHSDGTYFTYIHLSRFAAGLAVGARVRAGQTLGYVGKTGNTSVPHLHFEAHPFGGAAVNPTPIVNAAGGCRTRPGQTTPPPPAVPPTAGITKSFNPAVVVYNNAARVAKRTPVGAQVVGFPGISSSSSVAHLTVTLVGSAAGRASIWPCGTNAGLNGGSKLTATAAGTATSTTLIVKVGTGGRVCLEAEAAVSIKIAVNGVG